MTSHFVNTDQLPPKFPTHRHRPEFWEHLGRAVATYGFLEEVLARAVFSFTATRRFADSEVDAAFERWLPTLKIALTNPLAALIDRYESSVREHPDVDFKSLADLFAQLREASRFRNVLCHGSWAAPDENGASVPLFVDRKLNRFVKPVDCAFLVQTQRHVAEIACDVINSVTHMGWQFPGSSGPGAKISI